MRPEFPPSALPVAGAARHTPGSPRVPLRTLVGLFLPSFLAFALVSYLLKTGAHGAYPSLHSALDAGCAVTAGLIALSLHARVRDQAAGLLDLIWVSFVATAALETLHTVVGFEWIEAATRIARPLTWPPPALVLPGALGLALLFRARGVAISSRGFGLLLVGMAGLVLLVYSQLRPYSNPGWLGVTRPTLLVVPLLWCGVAVAAWRIRGRERLGTGLFLLSGFQVVAAVTMLFSTAPHDAVAMGAHTGKLLGYLQFQVFIALLGGLDSAELVRVAEALRLSEMALRVSETRLRLACSAARIGAWEWRRDSEQVECSEELLRLWQFPVSAGPGTRAECLAMVHPDDLAGVQEALHPAPTAGDTFRLECRVLLPGPGGREAWVEVVGFVEQALGAVERAYGSVQDITDRKRAEASLREAEEYASLVLDGAYDAFVAIDEHGTIGGWNRQAELSFGWSRAEALGKRLDEMIIPVRYREGHRRGLTRYLATGSGPVINQVTRLAALRRDGTEFPVELTISALRVHGDLVFAAFLRDITERVRDEEALRQYAAELEAANSELDAFAHSVSHDLRAPLRGIDGFSLALLEDHSEQLSAEGRSMLNRVRAASQRMGTLIDDLLDLSRVTRSELRRGPVDLSALASDIASDLTQSAPDRTAEFVIGGGITASCDPRLLRVALENLLGNAWKYTAKHARATIEFGASHRDGSVIYFVRDDGAGFDMAYVDKLFGPFQRLHTPADFEGSGIGLATVQRIIHRHGGRIWAEGAVERGATFHFTL